MPGMDGSGDLFAPFIASLDPGITPIVVRYPDAPLAYDQLAQYARRFLPEEGEFFLLGESFSGPVAAMLAARCDHRLRGLILSAAFIRNPLPWTAPAASLVRVLPVTGAPAALMTRLLLGRFSTPALRTMIAASLAQASAATIRARLLAISAVDVSHQMAAVQVPVLYLQASHDRVVPKSAGRLIARLQPGATCQTLQAPHFLLQAAAGEAARAVYSFMLARRAPGLLPHYRD
nr:alpha/beta hydrolase [Massilia sp. PAMC28688]